MRAVYWAVTLVAAALLIPFALSNRESVSLGFWPLPFLVDLPLYLLVLSLLLAGFVIGAAATWIAGRRIRRESSMNLGHGYVDFAGSTVVHAVGGFCAMALAAILGPRLGKFGTGGKIRAFPAHNVVYVVTGTFILLFGWMGFNWVRRWVQPICAFL